MDWLDFISKVGFPAAFCVALIVGLAKGASWLRPRADKVIDGHLNFIAGLDQRDTAQTECLKVLTEETKRHREMVSAHMNACGLVHKAKEITPQ